MPPLTEAQQEEVQRRLDEHARDPSSAAAWDEVRTRLWSRLG
jgi:putative addiction module component (TIGR02574 family)